MVILIVVAALFLAACVISFIERQMLSVTYYTHTIETEGKDGKAFRVAVISDLHCCTFGKNNEKLVRKIADLNPDALVIAGDLTTGDRKKNMTVPIEFLKKMCDKVPVYYGMGNHERKAYDLYGDAYYLDKIRDIRDLTLLRNECVKLGEVAGETLMLYGFDERVELFERKQVLSTEELSNAFANELSATTTSLKILIAHDPKYFKTYAEWGADIVLSGHYHGGIMRLPILGGVISPRFELFPKYDSGKFRQKESTMYLSRGLGNHSIPFRIFNRPEIMCIDIK